jgi:hypothetical protein
MNRGHAGGTCADWFTPKDSNFFFTPKLHLPKNHFSIFNDLPLPVFIVASVPHTIAVGIILTCAKESNDSKGIGYANDGEYDQIS